MPTNDDSETVEPGPATQPGQTIAGRFRVEKILGHGGMGEVLLARDTLLNRRVALKRVRAERAEAQGALRRAAILREARRASQVSDPRIASIYDVLEFDDDVLIVMEFVDGATLRERMSRPLPLGDFWGVATQCVEALGAAHDHGVIHRDIKPENLMVTPEGRVKILDFGIARRAEDDRGTAVAVTTTTTSEGRAPFIAGTPQYMAPEAHYGGRIDARTDIFSLGTVFYEMLTARNPFSGPTYDVVLDRVMNSTPTPAIESNPAVGPGLSAVIARMMAKDPAQRYPTCGDLMRHLTVVRRPGAAAPREIAVAPGAAPSRRAIPWRAAAIVIAVLAGAGTAFGLWRGFGPALPQERYLAVLAPLTPGATEDQAAFALGAIELLAARLQKQQDRAGFQLASFTETFDEKVSSAEEARKVQGANLALRTSIDERSNVVRARLDLWDTKRNRVIAARAVEAPIAQPHELLDRLNRETVRMLGLTTRDGGVARETGVRGAGTLRFLLGGRGRTLTATTEAQARRAVDEIELACRAEPDAGLARACRSIAERLCYTLGRDPAWRDRALASAAEAVARDSTRAEAWRALGDARAEVRDRAGALEAYRRSVELNPTDDYSALRLARTHFHLGHPELERESYATTIASRPHCWQPYWWLATWEFRQGNIEQAAGTFREMIRRSPDLNRGYAGLGGILDLLGAYDQAIDTLKIAIALRPNEIAFDNLGTAYFNSGRLEEAVAAYNQALQFGFASYIMWINLGDAYFWLPGHRTQAAEAYGEAVRLAREESARRAEARRAPDPMMLAWLSTTYSRLGQADSARVYLAHALRADSTNSQVEHCAALTLWQLGDRAAAIAWLAKAAHNGYPLTWIRDSPMFQEWREEEAFRSLIAGAGPGTRQSGSPAGGGRT